MSAPDSALGKRCKTIKEGDTCWATAQSCGIPLEKLYQVNPSLQGGKKCNYLQIGETLCCD
jgi:LysM repeat protein